MSMMYQRVNEEKCAPVHQGLGSFYYLHNQLAEIRIQDFLVCKMMNNNERAAFQQVDVPVSAFGF
jgi:hypothetical protein